MIPLTLTALHRRVGHRPLPWRRPALGRLWLVALLWCGLLSSASAHPHAWIDLDIVLEANASDEVIALTQTWMLDPTYSRYLYDDAMEQFEGAEPEERLARLGQEILDNLAEYDWYTELYADDRRVRAEPDASAPEMVMQGNRLHLRFRLVLAEAVPVRVHTLRYAIYDPTYFVELLHDTQSPPRLALHAGPCRLDVRKPRPDPVVVARALALDFNETGSADLGRHFAEQVTAHCD
jgi:ABC-type uncharacterized transport system substrate-binding protein